MSLKETLNRFLAAHSRGTFALARRYDVRPAEWTSPATGQRSRHGPDRGVPGPAGMAFPGVRRRERAVLARAFIAATAVSNIPTTSLLIEMLSADKTLRQAYVAWQRAGEVPSESTFSRAFAEFAASALPSRLHEALIRNTHSDRLGSDISHVTARRSRPGKNRRNQTSRHRHQSPNLSVAVPARGAPPAPPPPESDRTPAGGMTLAAMLADLPRACDVGAKRNAVDFPKPGSAISCISTPRTVKSRSVAC